MSHFTMLVAGADPDEQLAPYHEYESTGRADKYVKTFNVTKEYRKYYNEAKENYAANLKKLADGEITQEEFEKQTQDSFKGKTFLEFLRDYENINILEKKPEEFAEESNYMFAYPTTKGYTVIRRTNPNNFWDWYVIGGRYGGLLLLKKKDKDGSDIFVDQAKKKDIDFEEMWKRRVEDFTAEYNKVIELMGKVPVVETTWKTFCDKVDKNELTLDEAQKLYHEQPDVKLADNLYNKNKEFKNTIGFFGSIEDYSCTLDEFIQKRSCHALTYGFVHKCKWYAKGEMGWWACSSNEKEPSSWDEQYKNFIETLPENILLSVVDCHI